TTWRQTPVRIIARAVTGATKSDSLAACRARSKLTTGFNEAVALSGSRRRCQRLGNQPVSMQTLAAEKYGYPLRSPISAVTIRARRSRDGLAWRRVDRRTQCRFRAAVCGSAGFPA